jgi:hypothetical protein
VNWIKPPVSVMILACVYMAVGTIGFAYHFTQLLASQPDAIWVELTELLAIVCGAGMLRGYNWARWLAVSWIAAHVILSAFHSVREFAIHGLLCAVIVWLLFRPPAARFFRGVADPGV